MKKILIFISLWMGLYANPFNYSEYNNSFKYETTCGYGGNELYEIYNGEIIDVLPFKDMIILKVGENKKLLNSSCQGKFSIAGGNEFLEIDNYSIEYINYYIFSKASIGEMNFKKLKNILDSSEIGFTFTPKADKNSNIVVRGKKYKATNTN